MTRDPDARPPSSGRGMTLAAIGFLLLDGVLLVTAGLVGSSRGPLLWGALCVVAALAVWRFWRVQQRRLAELAAARRELASEARALRDLIRP